jgi:hypothetical protein
MDGQRPIYGRAATHLWTGDDPSMDGQRRAYGRATTYLWTGRAPSQNGVIPVWKVPQAHFSKWSWNHHVPVLLKPSHPTPTHQPNGPHIHRGSFHEYALQTPEAVEGMDILPGVAHFQNTIRTLARPSPMIVEMDGIRSPGPLWKRW